MVMVYFWFPETTGRPLEEIGALFGDRVAETLDEAGQRFYDEEKGPQVDYEQADLQEGAEVEPENSDKGVKELKNEKM